MTDHTPSAGSALLGAWSRWCRLVEWGWTFAGRVAARCEGRRAGLSPATRDRVISALEGDLDCLVDEAAERPITERAAEELLLTDALLHWLRGGVLPGPGAAELLEKYLAGFTRAPERTERELAEGLDAVLKELVRARAEATEAGPDEGEADVEALTRRDRRRFGQRLDELMKGKSMTVGELAVQSEIEVVRILGFIYGVEEARAVEMWSLAAALEAEPRQLFPGCLTEAEEDEEDLDAAGGPAGDGQGDA
jgi:hypothetical protein